ncbi:hypothetical protein [Mesorhizobium sp. KR1-2]|uniref:hypothetical protein n=1 Tax=Mesorhizobium sp. KR1-2 TaxID=3156609 RepID=UPI0032B587F7
MLTQVATLVAVVASIALTFRVEHDPGTAMITVTASVLAAWLLAEGVPTLVRLHGQAPKRTEPWQAFWKRIVTKLVGLGALSGLVIIACFCFPFFANSRAVTWLTESFPGLLVPMAVLVPLTVAYFVLADRYSDDPDDYLHQVGRAVLMREFREADIGLALRILVIKCFFLVLMFSSGMAIFEWFFDNPFAGRPFLSEAWFEAAVRAVYLVDVVLAAGGYFATFKLFGWHVRATETSLRGWVACLVCYEPFFPALSNGFVPYGEGPGWDSMLAEGSALFVVWSIAILLCHTVYVWATLALGPRFSNLTHRGIITNGPYRFAKHPAYLAKNAAWWLFSLPGFVASGFPEGVVRAGMLAIVSFIYVQRAMAEERMLSTDPVYRAYADEIAARSPWRAARRLAVLIQESIPLKRTG